MFEIETRSVRLTTSPSVSHPSQYIHFRPAMRRRHPRVRTALEHWSEEISVFFAGGTPRRRQFLEDPVVLKAAMCAVRAVKWKQTII